MVVVHVSGRMEWTWHSRGVGVKDVRRKSPLGNYALCRTIILSVVLYGCETWSLTLREERKLRVFEDMVLRRIFGPRRDEVTGE